jgi:hypothetical protein
MQFCEKQIEHDVVFFFYICALTIFSRSLLTIPNWCRRTKHKNKTTTKRILDGFLGVYTVCVSHQIHVILTVCH